MVKLCFFKWLFGINLNQVWSCLLHWIAIPRCSSSAILRRRSLLLVTAAGLKGSASGVEPPHAVGLNQSSTMRKKHWRLEILICIFDTNTPWSKRERIKQLLVSSEGITSITVYCITNNYRACMYFIALYIYIWYIHTYTVLLMWAWNTTSYTIHHISGKWTWSGGRLCQECSPVSQPCNLLEPKHDNLQKMSFKWAFKLNFQQKPVLVSIST